MAGERELVQHVDLQRAEAAAERDVLVRRDALVAKHQHVMVEMRAMNAREAAGVERLRQVEADHFGTERRIERHDVEMLRRNARPRRGRMPGAKRCVVADGGSRHGTAPDSVKTRIYECVPDGVNEAIPIRLSAALIKIAAPAYGAAAGGGHVRKRPIAAAVTIPPTGRVRARRLQDIRVLAGYDSDGAFGHAFQRIVGCSPRAYRHDFASESGGVGRITGR